MTRAVDKYLQFHAETESWLVEWFPRCRRFRHAVVIPACRETAGFLGQFQHPRFADSLIILVINQPTPTRDGAGRAAHWSCPDPLNRELHRRVQSMGDTIWQHRNLQLVATDVPAILLVDRFSTLPIPRQQGVGLARKIGCDIAVRLCREGIVEAGFIHSTDADALLPADYFSCLQRDRASSAQIYDFCHRCDASAVGQATLLYERSIRYYEAGLRWAGSPYAFTALGSCLAVSVGHYCQVRGFPRRSGGEDFYLLNKLAKLAPVIRLEGKPVVIQARHSDRVPFGTGPAVNRIVALGGDSYCDYDPRVFAELKQLLACFRELPSAIEGDGVTAWKEALTAESFAALETAGVETLLAHLRKQRLDKARMASHIDGWFDAFRTLKFIRFLQDRYYPPLPLDHAEAMLDEMRENSEPDPEPADVTFSSDKPKATCRNLPAGDAAT